MTKIKNKNQNSGDALKTELNVLEHLLVRQGTNLTSKPQKPKSENYLAIVNTTMGGNDKKNRRRGSYTLLKTKCSACSRGIMIQTDLLLLIRETSI